MAPSARQPALTGKDVFDRLVRDDQPALQGFVAALVHNDADAEDVCQKALLAAWEKFRDYDPDRSSFATWLRGIARHKVVDLYRSNEAYLRHVKLVTPETMQRIEEELAGLVGEGREVIEWTALASIVRACLSTLTKQQRDLVHQRYFETKTCSAIASFLKKKLNTVKVGLRRARAAMHECIVSKLGTEPRI